MPTSRWGDAFLCVAEDPGWLQPLLCEQLAVTHWELAPERDRGFCLWFSAFAGPCSSPGVTPGRLYINSKYQRETSEIQENIAGKWLLSNGAVKAAAQIRENRFKCFLLFPREVLSAGSSSFLLPHVFLPFIVFSFFPSVGKGFFPLTHYNQQSQDEFFIVHLSLLQGWGWGPSMLLRSGEPSQRLCLEAHSDFSATGGVSP